MNILLYSAYRICREKPDFSDRWRLTWSKTRLSLSDMMKRNRAKFTLFSDTMRDICRAKSLSTYASADFSLPMNATSARPSHRIGRYLSRFQTGASGRTMSSSEEARRTSDTESTLVAKGPPRSLNTTKLPILQISPRSAIVLKIRALPGVVVYVRNTPLNANTCAAVRVV